MHLSDGKERTLVPEGWARIGPACALPHVLQELGVEPKAFLAELNVAPDLFDDPERVMSYPDGGRLLAACAEKTGAAHFGHLIGRHCSLAELGLVGQAAAAAADVGSVLRTICRYLPLFDRGAVMTLRRENRDVSWSFNILASGIVGVEQFHYLAITVAFNTLKDLCGGAWRPSLVTFPHKAPRDPRPLRAFFGAELRFDADGASVVFDREWLARPLPDATEAEWRRLVEQAEALEARLGVSLSERVRRHVRASAPARWPPGAEVAKSLSMSGRLMRLRLAEEGASFRQIVDDLRYETARHYLAASDLAPNEIALLLGYADVTAFTRAFRRWAGTAPAAWRATRRRAAPEGIGSP